MPEITPDSPVTALWRDYSGGLNGARARARLKFAGVAAVGELIAMDADDIRAIPRAGDSVLAEVRLALTLSGLHLAGDPAPSRLDIGEARRIAKAAPGPLPRPPRQGPEPPPPVGREEFTALVNDIRAELEQADKDRRRQLLAVTRLETPAAFTGRPWVWHLAGPEGTETVTGYSQASIRRYAARSAREHAAGTATHRTMPAPRHGRWAIGDLAMWVATRNEGQAAGLILTDEDAARIRAEADAVRHPVTGRLPRRFILDQAARYGVSWELISKLVRGALPAEGRLGVTGARDVRRSGLIPQVAALYGREGRITRRMVMGALDIPDHRTALRLIREAGLEEEARRAEDEDVAAFAAARIARERRHVPAAELLAAAAEAGLPANITQIRRIMPGVRAAEARRRHKPSGGLERARGESLRADGLLYGAEVAEDWAVSQGAVTKAVERGELRVAKTEKGRRLYDPARLRVRADKRRTPVDKDHELARKEPGDEGYEG